MNIAVLTCWKWLRGFLWKLRASLFVKGHSGWKLGGKVPGKLSRSFVTNIVLIHLRFVKCPVELDVMVLFLDASEVSGPNFRSALILQSCWPRTLVSPPVCLNHCIPDWSIPR